MNDTTIIPIGPIFVKSLLGNIYKRIDAKLENGLLNRSEYFKNELVTIQKTITLDSISKRILFLYKAIYIKGYQEGKCGFPLSKCEINNITNGDISVIFCCPINLEFSV